MTSSYNKMLVWGGGHDVILQQDVSMGGGGHDVILQQDVSMGGGA